MNGLDLTVSEKINIKVLLKHELEDHQSDMLRIYREDKVLKGLKSKKKDCKDIYKIIDKIEDSMKS